MAPDIANRFIDSVDADTNGGTARTRPSSVPSSAPTLLVSNYAYNSAGWRQDSIDPMGIDTRTNYDNVGRVIQTIQDYTGGAETAESNISTQYGYDGNNNVTYVQADEPGGNYQKTGYVYGVTTASGSGVNSNDILSAIQHPDPSSGQPSASQQELFHVDALGDVVQSTDRNGNVHQYSYDVLGRITSDAVTTLGAGVDGTIRQITYGYDSQGNLSLITSYNAPSGGSIVNQVQRVFKGLGQLTGEYQSHSGSVNTSSTPEVQYAYTEMSGGQNNSRLVSMTYPSGYVLNFNYNSGLDGNISRLSSISDASNTLESYKYLGLDTVVERDHPQNNVNLSYIKQSGDTQYNSDGGDQYTGLDRFGRVIDQNWVNGTTGTSTDRFQYGYNPDSDVLYRQNLVDAVMSELYQYDNLHQLISFARGTLNATKNGISGTPSRSQGWTPDALGNFTGVTTNGTTQTRSANQQNEYTSISGSGTITYDANGNITADGSGNNYVYDSWNNLVAVKNGGTTVASYGYDGLGRRMTETHGSTTTDLYLSAANQVLEERQGGVVQARNVWSPVYVNALILRDQSSLHNGVLDQRLYVQQDANWNVTALVDTNGNVLERYDYDPFGAQTVLNPDFSVRGTSSYSVPYSFQGMRTDSLVNLQFANDRVYSPTLMRWLQTDPIGLNAGNNNYAMEGNGPTGAVDPSGLDPVGQHYVPVSVAKKLYKERKITLDAVRVAAGYYSGPTLDAEGKGHRNTTYGGVKHSDYNKLVEKELRDYISKNAKKGRLNKNQMKNFLDKLAALKARNKDINSFNCAVQSQLIPGKTPKATDANGYIARGKSYADANRRRFTGIAMIGALAAVFGGLGKAQAAYAFTNSKALGDAIQALGEGNLPAARASMERVGQELDLAASTGVFPVGGPPPSFLLMDAYDAAVSETVTFTDELIASETAEPNGNIGESNGFITGAVEGAIVGAAQAVLPAKPRR